MGSHISHPNYTIVIMNHGYYFNYAFSNIQTPLVLFSDTEQHSGKRRRAIQMITYGTVLAIAFNLLIHSVYNPH